MKTKIGKTIISIILCLVISISFVGCELLDGIKDKLGIDQSTSESVETESSNGMDDPDGPTNEEQKVEVESVELSAEKLNLTVGEQHLLNARVLPNDATDMSITWTSSNENIATVFDGLISAKAEGNVTIAATTSNGKIAMCMVKVSSDEDFNDSDLGVVKPGQTAKLKAYAGNQVQTNDGSGFKFENSLNVNDEYYVYYFYLGVITRVPVYTSVAPQYIYDTEVKMTFQELKEESFSETVSKSMESIDTHSYTGGFEVGFEEGIEAEGSALFVDVKASLKATQSTDHHWTNNWGSTLTDSNSTENSYLTQYSMGWEESVNFSESAGFTKGNYYRLSFYETVKAYGVLIYNVKENTYSSTSDYFLKKNTTVRVWEESTDGNFDYEQHKDLYFDVNEAIKYAEQNKPTIEENPSAIVSNSQITTSSFSSYLWAEDKNLGMANFQVTGIKVKYNDSYYIYGNAWYEGKLSSNFRFNDVDAIYLKNSTSNILMGGILHWKGSYSDNNESGVASWNRAGGMNSTTISYMPEDPGKDIAADKTISISITDICVKCDGKPTLDDGVPEIATTTLKADFVCESKKMGRITFDVIGIKAKYNNSYYLMGNAFYNGKPGTDRFNDVGDIYLKNCDKKILFGGTLGWRGSINDNNESGICGYNRNNGFNSNAIRYMMEDPGKDFSAGENNYISITGICVEIGGDAKDDALVAEIVTTKLTSSLNCESDFSGSANFDCIGIKTVYNGEIYLYGNAFSTGNPGRDRFNDVARFRLTDTTKEILLGGTLHWYGSNSDNNESAIVGFNKSSSTGNSVEYLQEDPGKDFAANEGNELSITGVCIKI